MSQTFWQSVRRNMAGCPTHSRVPRATSWSILGMLVVSQAFWRSIPGISSDAPLLEGGVPGILAVSQVFWQSAPGIPALSHAHVRCLRPSDGISRILAACPRHSGTCPAARGRRPRRSGRVQGLASPRWSCSGCQGTRERCSSIPAALEQQPIHRVASTSGGVGAASACGGARNHHVATTVSWR